jgi:hypothetical protein
LLVGIEPDTLAYAYVAKIPVALPASPTATIPLGTLQVMCHQLVLRVLDGAGQPAANAMVRLENRDDPGWHLAAFDRRSATTTDANGGLVADWLPTGRYRLLVLGNAGARADLELVIPLAEQPLRVALR